MAQLRNTENIMDRAYDKCSFMENRNDKLDNNQKQIAEIFET